jgi:carboxyl-terminal processing protease
MVINDINEVYLQALGLFDEAEKLAFSSKEKSKELE